MNASAAPRRPVARRLFTRLLVQGAVLAALAIGVELALEFRHNDAELAERFAAVEDGYLPSVRENAWLDDRERLAFLVRGIQSMPWIAEVEVTSPDGTVLARHGSPASQPETRVWPLSRLYNGQDYPLGQLRVTAGLEEVHAATMQRLVVTAASYLAVIALLATLLTVQVRRLMVRRLSAIAAHARRLGRDGPVATPPLALDTDTRDDEFTDLARTLRHMQTELAGAYDTVAASETRYRELFTSSPVSLWEEDFSAVAEAVRQVDPGGRDFAAWLEANPQFVLDCAARVRIIDFNEATLKLHRAGTRGELLGNLPAVFTPSSFAAFRQQLAAIREGRYDVLLDTEVRTVDGEAVDVVVHWHVLPQYHASYARVIVSQQDVTALKQAQRSAETAMEKLMQSNAELERFAYIASHDLQEPVRLVVSFSQLLGRRLQQGGLLTPDIAEDLAFLEQAAGRMQSQVMGLLDYTHAGQTVGSFERFPLAGALEEAKSLLGDELKDVPAAITATALPEVLGDRAQLIQLFHHLLDNALKFRHPQRPLAIEVSARPDGPDWRITVADNGIGIEPQYAERIFEVFRRLHGPGRYPGAGIGLAICRRIVERHGGRITIDTSRPEGAAIVFTLPASQL